MPRRIKVLLLALLLVSALGACALRSTPSVALPGRSDNGPVKPVAKPDPPAPSPDTTYIREDGRVMVADTDSILVLVNKNRNLPADFVPKDLVRVNALFPFDGDQPRMYLRREAARALEELIAAARTRGLELYAISGYRSYETQAAIFAANADKVGEETANMTSARAGQSEHQTGLAMDLTSPLVRFKLVESFGATAEGVWLAENAHHFGFIVRYPKGKEHITGYSYEPWHVRYIGSEAANLIFSRGLTLEEHILLRD